MDEPPSKNMFSVKEFLAIYPISRSTLYHEIKLGKLKSRELGRRVYILRKDADAWAEALEEKVK
jgi:predicted DNA-binding transcriptional regulator AlpA